MPITVRMFYSPRPHYPMEIAADIRSHSRKHRPTPGARHSLTAATLIRGAGCPTPMNMRPRTGSVKALSLLIIIGRADNSKENYSFTTVAPLIIFLLSDRRRIRDHLNPLATYVVLHNAIFYSL